jgi:hypothetical protein
LSALEDYQPPTPIFILLSIGCSGSHAGVHRMAQDTTPATSLPLSRSQQYALYGVLVAAFAGILLAWWQPFWLKPEGFVYTPFVYAVIALLWIPVLVVLAVIPATRFRLNRFRVMALIILMFVALSTAAVKYVAGSLMSIQAPGVSGKTWNCATRRVANSSGGELTRWTCMGPGFMDSAPILIFEGNEADLFVRLVENSMCSNQDCANYP